MALKLSQNTTQGVTGEYWRIDSMSWTKAPGTANVMMALYKDEATAKTAGSTPLLRRGVSVTGISATTPLADCYKQVKASRKRRVNSTDKDGKITTTEVETNPFVDAVDA